MKTLWFKSCYVAPILSGEKTDTIRKATCKLRAGETVAFTVGPRPPFAMAKIIKRENIELNDLSNERMMQVTELYEANETFCKLTFMLLDSLDQYIQIRRSIEQRPPSC